MTHSRLRKRWVIDRSRCGSIDNTEHILPGTSTQDSAPPCSRVAFQRDLSLCHATPNDAVCSVTRSGICSFSRQAGQNLFMRSARKNPLHKRGPSELPITSDGNWAPSPRSHSGTHENCDRNAARSLAVQVAESFCTILPHASALLRAKAVTKAVRHLHASAISQTQRNAAALEVVVQPGRPACRLVSAHYQQERPTLGQSRHMHATCRTAASVRR